MNAHHSTTPEADTGRRAEWLKAEAAYRATIDRILARPDSAPTKDDYIELAQARARADHKQARYFKECLRT